MITWSKSTTLRTLTLSTGVLETGGGIGVGMRTVGGTSGSHSPVASLYTSPVGQVAHSARPGSYVAPGWHRGALVGATTTGIGVGRGVAVVRAVAIGRSVGGELASG